MSSVTGSITGFNNKDECLCSMEVIAEDGEELEITSADNEYVCLLQCRGETRCTHYSYTEVLHYCQLWRNSTSFTSLVNEGVKTGPKQCIHQDGKCGLSLLGSSSNNIVNTPYDQEFHVRSAMKNCEVTVDLITVGAGGRSFSPEGSGKAVAGGGSGYVHSTSVSVMVDSIITIEFVEDGMNCTYYYSISYMDFLNTNVSIQSMCGEKGSDKGGNGYSGGGYNGDGYGGFHQGGEGGSNGNGCNQIGK